MMNSLHLAKTTMTFLLLFLVAIATAKSTDVKSLRSTRRVPSRSLPQSDTAASTNSAGCPKSLSTARSGDSCALGEFERCEYDPHVRCPNDPPIYIYSCECFGGEFACLSYAMTPCDDEKEPETIEGEENDQFHILPHYPEEEPTEKEPKEEENDKFHTLPFPDVKEEDKCPEEQPQENSDCTNLPNNMCDYELYEPEHCKGQRFPRYSCFCEGGEFTCVINDMTICIEPEPKPEPKPESEPKVPVLTVCPESHPLGSKIYLTCDMDSKIACNYKPVECKGFAHYSQQCFCHDGGFLCIESAIACEALDEEKPKEVKRKEVTVCPLSDPLEEDMYCNMDEHITCNYKPVTCNGYERHTQKCSCEGGKFNCLVIMMICEEPKEPEPKVPVATVCPQSAPSDPYKMMCDMNSETACNYDPLDCASSILHGTTCVCNDGHFSCISPKIFCPEPQMKCNPNCSNNPSRGMRKKSDSCTDVFGNIDTKTKRQKKILRRQCRKFDNKRNKKCQLSCAKLKYIDVVCCDDATE